MAEIKIEYETVKKRNKWSRRNEKRMYESRVTDTDNDLRGRRRYYSIVLTRPAECLSKLWRYIATT